jgi:hypothetical protein
MSIWPAITLLMLWAVSLGINVAQHGEPKKGNENAWITVMAMLVTGSILWWGGFFVPLMGF